MILRCSKKNIKRLLEIESICFSNGRFTLKKSGFRYHLKKKQVLGLRKKGEIVAYLAFIKFKKRYSITYLASYEKNKGYAAKLLNEFKLLINGSKVSLECTFDKIVFYQKFIDIKKIKKMNNYFYNEDGFKIIGYFK